MGLYQQCIEEEMKRIPKIAKVLYTKLGLIKIIDRRCMNTIEAMYLTGNATEEDLKEAGFDSIEILRLMIIRELIRKWKAK